MSIAATSAIQLQGWSDSIAAATQAAVMPSDADQQRQRGHAARPADGIF